MLKDLNEQSTDEDWRKAIDNFKDSPRTKAVQGLFSQPSLLSIIGRDRREIYHTRFISWLLDRKENHELQSIPFLGLMNGLIHSGYLNIAKSEIDSETFEVQTEKRITIEYKDKSCDGQIDIIIFWDQVTESGEREKHIIVIENKVDSMEHQMGATQGCPQQSEGYFDWAKYNYPGKATLLWLLPLDYPHPGPDDSNFKTITYQNLLDWVIEPAAKYVSNANIRSIFDQYIQTLLPSLTTSESAQSQSKIMGVPTMNKDVLRDFYDEYVELFLMVIKVLNLEESDTGFELDENVKEALSVSSGNRTKVWRLEVQSGEEPEHLPDKPTSAAEVAFLATKKAVEAGSITPEKINTIGRNLGIGTTPVPKGLREILTKAKDVINARCTSEETNSREWYDRYRNSGYEFTCPNQRTIKDVAKIGKEPEYAFTTELTVEKVGDYLERINGEIKTGVRYEMHRVSR